MNKSIFYERLFFQLAIDNNIIAPVYVNNGKIVIDGLDEIRINDLPDPEVYDEMEGSNMLEQTLKLLKTSFSAIEVRWNEVYSDLIAETYSGKRVLISHVDLDGYGSIILGLLTSQFDLIFSCTRQAFTDNFKLQLSKAEMIYICDLCPPESWFDMENVRVFDHHPNKSKLLDDPQIKNRILIDKSRCGTRLFYEEVIRNVLIENVKIHKKIDGISNLWRSICYDNLNIETIDDFVHLVDTFDRWLNKTPDFSLSIELQKMFLSSVCEFKPRYRSCILSNHKLSNYGRNFILWLVSKLTEDNFRTIDKVWQFNINNVNETIKRRYETIANDLESNKLQIQTDENDHKYLIFNKVTIYDHTFVTHYLLEHLNVDYVICNYSDQPQETRTGSARSISFDLTSLKNYLGGHEHAARVSTSEM